MSTKPKILAFAGSLRAGSFNKKLVKLAAAGAERAGATVTCIDLKDSPLPVFDEDLETAEGLPASASSLKDLFRAHDGLLIASPEYNSSISAALKNAIDWVSRAEDQPFNGKAIALMGASMGILGSVRAQYHLR